jgi:hypothetical protein
MKAKINSNEIEVRHSIRPDVGREFLTVQVPNGWDDCKKISNKVLTFEGRRFIWSGWNSDRNEAFFFKPLESENKIGIFA